MRHTPQHIPKWTDEVQAEFERLYEYLGNTGSREDIIAYLIVEVERLQEALHEARAGLKEAYEYGCEWPIGLDTDSQEQRGMDRDTFIGNMEYFLAQIDAAVAQPQRSDP